MFFDRCGSSSIFSRRWRRYLERSALGSSCVNSPLDTRPCVVPKGVNLPPPCREPPDGFKPPASLGVHATPPPARLPYLTPNTQQESEADIRGGKKKKKRRNDCTPLAVIYKNINLLEDFFFFLKKTCTICIIETTSASAAVTSLEAKETTVF